MESTNNTNTTPSIGTQLSPQQTAIEEDQELIDVTTIKPEEINVDNNITEMDIDSVTPKQEANIITSATTIDINTDQYNTDSIKVETNANTLNDTMEATTSNNNSNISGSAVNTTVTITNSNINTSNTVPVTMSTTSTNNNNNNNTLSQENKTIQNNNTVLNNTDDTTVTISTTNFEEIQKQLKKTLDHVEQRNMVSGFETLSKATSAVVDHCEQLGLTSDDHPYNAIDREQFWAGLNNCWLYALAQRQEPSSSEEKVTDQHLFKLREKVVAWADKLERFGLVDYEMGWWEADILAAIDGCLALNYATAQAAVAQVAASIFNQQQPQQPQQQPQQQSQQQPPQQQEPQQQPQHENSQDQQESNQ